MHSLPRYAALGLLLLSACAQETIAHQQEEREANRILVLLGRTNIEATKVQDEAARELRFNVLVDQGDAADALAVLERHNLPEARRPDTATMFQESGLIPTSEQERAKRVVGVEGDIVNALRQLPRVVSVQAAVSIPIDNPLRDVNEARPKPKASVIVVYAPDESNAPPLTAKEFQEFVQGKLSELKSAEVTVLLVPAAPGEGAVAAAAPAVDPALGCVQKERVLGIDVCQGNKKKLLSWLIGVGFLAAVLALLAVVATLRAMRYRKDITRLTAQFQRHS